MSIRIVAGPISIGDASTLPDINGSVPYGYRVRCASAAPGISVASINLSVFSEGLFVHIFNYFSRDFIRMVRNCNSGVYYNGEELYRVINDEPCSFLSTVKRF